MAGSLIVPVVAPSAAAVPPDSSHYTFYIGDGTEGSTAGTYYKKNSSSVSTALIPTAYTDENAQDAAAALFSDNTEFDVTYNDAGNALGIVVFSGSLLYSKIQNVSATQRFLGRNTAGAGSMEELTPTVAKQILSWTMATRAIVADGSALTTATTEQIVNGSAFSIPANTISVGEVIHGHYGLAVTQALLATATNTIIKAHFGPLGTTGDPIVASCAVNLNGTVAGTGRTLVIDTNIAIRSSTTAIGDIDAHGSAIIAPVAATVGLAVLTPIAVSLSVANILTITLQQPTANITGGTLKVAFVEKAA